MKQNGYVWNLSFACRVGDPRFYWEFEEPGTNSPNRRIAVDTGGHNPEVFAKAKTSIFDFTLVPNPASEQVTIKFNDALDEFAAIELLDGFGKSKSTISAKGNSATLDLVNLPPGLYAVRVLSHGKHVTKKLVLVK